MFGRGSRGTPLVPMMEPTDLGKFRHRAKPWTLNRARHGRVFTERQAGMCERRQ